jgi:hypothetical protein
VGKRYDVLEKLIGSDWPKKCATQKMVCELRRYLQKQFDNIEQYHAEDTNRKYFTAKNNGSGYWICLPGVVATLNLYGGVLC